MLIIEKEFLGLNSQLESTKPSSPHSVLLIGSLLLHASCLVREDIEDDREGRSEI